MHPSRLSELHCFHPLAVRFISLAVLAVASFAPVAGAHDGDHPVVFYNPPEHDRPAAPLRSTEVFFPFLEHPDMDDGFPCIFGCDAELSLAVKIAHLGHGFASKDTTEEDLDYDETHGLWVPFLEIYQHLECSPMNELIITVSGFEADATTLDELESALLQIASKIGALLLTQNTHFDVDAGKLQDIVTAVLAKLNPDDTLGLGYVNVPAPGTYDVTTTGGDYSVTATFDVTSNPVAGGACDPDSAFVPPPPPPCYFSTEYFDRLSAACNLIDQIQVEEGDPGHVTAQDLADAKASLRTLVIGMAYWAAAHMVEDARGLSGFSSSYVYLQQGAANGTEAAILDFRQAFCAAEFAILNNVPDPFAPSMNPAAVTVPKMIATRAGRTADYLLGVFGNGSSSALVQNVTGLPPGASFTLEAVDPAHPSWRVLHVSQSGPPGTYPLQVTFTNPQVSPITLVLDVDQASATGVELIHRAPERIALHPVRPNPVVRGGSVVLDLPSEATVDVRIYDVVGRLVRDLVRDSERGPGRHVFAFDARSLSAGVYYVRLEARSADGTTIAQSQKFVVTR